MEMEAAYCAGGKRGKAFVCLSLIHTHDGVRLLTYSYDDSEKETVKYAVFNIECIQEFR